MNHLRILRQLALLEGISYLLLFGVTMPLKYIWDIPEPNYVVGVAHGALFIAYCVWVLLVTIEKKWSFKTMFLAGIASIIPFGTFVADKKIFLPEASQTKS